SREIELAPVFDRQLSELGAAAQAQLAQRRVGAKIAPRAGLSDLRGVAQALRLRVATLEAELADLSQRRQRCGVVGVFRSARPQAIFVQLPTIVSYAAENHR